MYKNPLQAYQEADKSGMTGREVEAYALTKAAKALRECRDCWDTSERDQLLEHALKLNQRLWSILQAELTMAENPLPALIKQNLLRLSIFIDNSIIQIFADPKLDLVNIIIDINENLASGLRQNVEVMDNQASSA